MAIIDEIPGIEVTIVVNGQLADEYVDPDPSDQKLQSDPDCPICTRYIEAVEGHPFSTRVTFDRKECKKYVRGGEKHPLNIHTMTSDGASGFQKVLFDETTPEAAEIFGRDQFSWVYTDTEEDEEDEEDEDGPTNHVNEDIKTVQRIGLIEVSITPPHVYGRASGLLEGNGRFAVFRFMYRPKERLKNLFVDLRSLSPETNNKSILKDLTSDYIFWMERQRTLNCIDYMERRRGTSLAMRDPYKRYPGFIDDDDENDDDYVTCN